MQPNSTSVIYKYNERNSKNSQKLERGVGGGGDDDDDDDDDNDDNNNNNHRQAR